MGIEVATVTEDHAVIRQVGDPTGLLTSLAMNRWAGLDDTVCLRFIDPWGDAVFNQAQIPELLQELRAEINVTENGQARAHLQVVAELVQTAVEQTHVYVKFIGD